MDYVQIFTYENSDDLSVYFTIEDEKVMKIGEKMNELNEEAYMNGYNWDAFLNYYLGKYHPEIKEGMDCDPEAGTYVAYYKSTPQNELKAKKLVEIIEDLIENESKLYKIVEEEGDKIEWD